MGDVQHGLHCGREHDEEDDAEQEGPLQRRRRQQARLQGEQEQRHALRQPSDKQNAAYLLTRVRLLSPKPPLRTGPLCTNQVEAGQGTGGSPVHDVVVVQCGVVAPQEQLAEVEQTQRQVGHHESQTQQRVRRGTAFGNTARAHTQTQI